MKVKLPAREVECCDRCRRSDVLLQTCIACGARYCLACNGVVPGCMVSADLCYECTSDGMVWDLVRKYGQRILPIVRERDAKLAKMRRRILAGRKRAGERKA